MATAELAAVLPVLVGLLLVAVGVLAAAGSALRCEDAARLAARSLARGDPQDETARLAVRSAPHGAAVAYGDAGPGLVRVVVRDRVQLPGPLGHLLPAVTVSGAAVALREDAPG